MSLSGLAYAGLEQTINSYLALDPAAQRRMAELYGKVIAFELLGLDQTLYFIPGPGRLQVRHRRLRPGAGVRGGGASLPFDPVEPEGLSLKCFLS